MMAEIPYGVSDEEPNVLDDPWTKLATINEHLEARERIPNDLARWLGGAIVHANEDPNEFLRRLGLKRGRGAVSDDPNAWRTIGERICRLEDNGARPEEALKTILDETFGDHDRSTLQRWRDKYRGVSEAALNPE